MTKPQCPAQPLSEQPSSALFGVDDEGALQRLCASPVGEDDAFSSPERSAVFAALRAFVKDARYPCVGAKSALNLNAFRVGFYAPLNSSAAVARCAQDAAWFADNAEVIDGHFATFMAVFHGPSSGNEADFSEAFWAHLSSMLTLDRQHYEWDSEVSNDPADPNFALSLGGHAFFVVAMHPAASRLARRFPVTTLVFNLHSQFEALRAARSYKPMRDTVRKRDARLQGSSNPMVEDFGGSSGALQYDGMAHPDDWVAPLKTAPPASPGGCPYAEAAAAVDGGSANER